MSTVQDGPVTAAQRQVRPAQRRTFLATVCAITVIAGCTNSASKPAPTKISDQAGAICAKHFARVALAGESTVGALKSAGPTTAETDPLARYDAQTKVTLCLVPTSGRYAAEAVTPDGRALVRWLQDGKAGFVYPT